MQKEYSSRRDLTIKYSNHYNPGDSPFEGYSVHTSLMMERIKELNGKVIKKKVLGKKLRTPEPTLSNEPKRGIRRKTHGRKMPIKQANADQKSYLCR